EALSRAIPHEPALYRMRARTDSAFARLKDDDGFVEVVAPRPLPGPAYRPRRLRVGEPEQGAKQRRGRALGPADDPLKPRHTTSRFASMNAKATGLSEIRFGI